LPTKRIPRGTPDNAYPSAQPPRRQTRARPHTQYLTNDLPLAVWTCAQKTSQWQRRGRYLPESNRHPGKMLPAIARHAIETYSDPGALILDPMCGIGTTLVEAVHVGRQAVGVELEPRWVKLARANIKLAHHQGATAAGHVIRGDARKASSLLSKTMRRLGRVGPAGTSPSQVDLILTSPPYGCHVAGVSAEASSGAGPLTADDAANYSADRTNLGHARGRAYLEAMAEIYDECVTVLKPGGFLILVTKDMRADGALRDLSGATITLCKELGLHYWQRIIGLLATVRDHEIVMGPSLWQTLQVRRARARGDRTHVVAHEDVLVFRKRNEP
jgi:modification methylase